MKSRLRIKEELVYLFLILAITVLFNASVLKLPLDKLVILGSVGFVLLQTWFIKNFAKYSAKKISKYSEVLIRISLKDRFFGYFILPSLFYISLLFFLYYNRNLMLGYMVLGVCIVLLFVLFLNVKSSLRKMYSLALATRAIFDFLCITIFYLLLNTFVRVGFSFEMFTVLSLVSAFILLLFVLKIHDRMGSLEMLVSAVSAIAISLITAIFWDYGIFVIPAIGSLSFYLVISLWNVRFAGKINLVDYLIPFLYVLMASILIIYV